MTTARGAEKLIPNSAYFDPGSLIVEMEEIFRPSWQFACLVDEVSQNNDFVCINLPDDAIVVQNFRGSIRAFQNICSHRLSLIQWEDRGNRRLSCRYHGWTFAEDGRPLGYSAKREFIDGRDPAELCLPRYRVETCGRFVFVSRATEGPALDEYLGGFAELLQLLSTCIGAEVYFGSIRHASNWKLLVENVLECYHCSTVHPETFVTGLGVGREKITDVQFAGSGPLQRHSSSHFPRVPTRRENLRQRITSHLAARSFAHDSFFHAYVFPNLFISSTEGLTFYVGHVLPVTGGESDLRVRFFEPNVELDAKGRARQHALTPQSVQLGLQVIEEDRAVLADVQRGIAVASRHPALGPEESRIRAFHEAWIHHMHSEQ